MADYLRLADDAKIAAEQKLSLAISGWLLGSGAAIDNLARQPRRWCKVRELVRQYLRHDAQAERDAILAQLDLAGRGDAGVHRRRSSPT